ncbi:MAG: SH3 domain-containing protein [Proteobacteria bacterium]|nr:SH3 domain-containing protein [Pseudomonadota bacterium]
MRHLLPLLLCAQILLGTPALVTARTSARPLALTVTEPYVEMHSGPGRGYPVTYVVGRGDSVQVMYSRTDWFKVRASRGQEGWVKREELALTQLADGSPAPIPPYPDFTTHTWEFGAAYGVYNHQNLVAAYVDYAITDSLDAELTLQQAMGTIDNRYLATLGIRHTFIPEWKWLSPTAGLGTGVQYIDKSTPPQPLDKTNQVAYVTLGLRGFITRKFMWRLDWRNYVVFTRENDNKEPEEWKFALAVFF